MDNPWPGRSGQAIVVLRQVTGKVSGRGPSQSPSRRRLPAIGEKSKEGKDRRMVAGEPVTLAHVHRLAGFRSNSRNREFLPGSWRQEPVR
jgi:hypothetical protein